MLSVLALALPLACRAVHTPPDGSPASTLQASGPAASGAIQRLAVDGLRDVACLPEGCLVWQTTWRAHPDVAPVGASSSASTLAWWAADASALVPVGIEGGDPAAWTALRFEGTDLVVDGACGGAAGDAAASATACETRWTLRPAEAANPPRLVPRSDVPERRTLAPLVRVVDEPPPAREDAAAWTTAWNLGRARAWRSPFSRVVVAPGGAMLAYFRGPGGGTLVRSPGRGAVRVVAPDAPASWPAWLAMHPTGTEAYLLPWPASVLVAVDPASLATRWSLPLEAPAHGLFIDPVGRWLLAEVAEGDAGAVEALRARWTDWPTPVHHAPADDALAQAVGLAQAPDPTRDELVRAWERPPATSVSVVDLARGEETLRVAGAYRRWSILPDGRLLLATDRAVVIHRPEPPETP